MRAILLAAGCGTRLQPLTNNIPKCLVPINGQPLLDIWLERLSRAGIASFLVNTHYLAEKVEAYVATSRYAKHTTLVHEAALLGTAGTLVANVDFYEGEDGLLIHADNYCRADIQEFLLAHARRPAECVMTMMSFRTDTPSSCGILELDERGVVFGFHEKSALPLGNLANGAVYLLSPELLRMMRGELSTASDFSTEVLHRLVGRIYTYETGETFVDVGTPDSYARANATGTQ